MINIPDSPLLTSEQEQALAVRIKAGDEAAIAELVNANLRLIPYFARRYKERGHSTTDDDMDADGAYGLFRAARSFRPLGLRFSTWARQWVTQQISIGIAYDRTIHLPYRMVVDAHYLKRARSRLGVGATTEEIAEAAGMDAEYADDVLDIERSALSLDNNIFNMDGDGTFVEAIEDRVTPPPDEVALDAVMREDILAELGTLPGRAGAVIAELYGITDGRPKTLRETGQIFGISGQAVDQTRDKFLRKLRKRKILQEYNNQLCGV